MNELASIFVAAVGLAFGSFLNVCIARLPRHESIVRPVRAAPHCGAPITARDNVPLLSFMLLQGRCRACRETICMALSCDRTGHGGALGALLARFGPTLQALGMAALCFLLLGLAAMDAETMRLPNSLHFFGHCARRRLFRRDLR